MLLNGNELLPSGYEAVEHPLEPLLRTVVGPEASVAGSDVRGLDLSGRYLPGMRFDGATLDGVSLVGAGLAAASFAAPASTSGLQAHGIHTDLQHTGTFAALRGFTYTFEHPEGAAWGSSTATARPTRTASCRPRPRAPPGRCPREPRTQGCPSWTRAAPPGRPVETAAHPLAFTVTLEAKGAAHPHYQAGSGFAYAIDGVQAASLTLYKGVAYTFDNGQNGAVYPMEFGLTADGAASATVDVAVLNGKFALSSTVPLVRGQRYVFENPSQAAHPFRLSAHPDGRVDGVEAPYTAGFSDASGTTLTFHVPEDAPDTLHYYCASHAGMGGALAVQDQAAFDATTDGLHVTTLVSHTASVLHYHAADPGTHALMGGGTLVFEEPPVRAFQVGDGFVLRSPGQPPSVSGGWRRSPTRWPATSGSCSWAPAPASGTCP